MVSNIRSSALQRSEMHLEHGCSSAIHYATRVLGMKAKEARLLRHVAPRLGELPGLAQLASPETEAVWLDLCQQARQDLAAEQVRDEALLAKCPARDNSEWLATVAAREEECPGNGHLSRRTASRLAHKKKCPHGANRESLDEH